MNAEVVPQSVTTSGHQLRLLVRTSLAYLPSRVIPALVGVAALPALGRFLAPAEFGTLSLVTAALPYVAVVVGDWVLAGYQRQAHLVDDGEEAQATSWVIALGVGSSMLLVGAGLVSGRNELQAVGLLLAPYLLMRMQWTKLQMTGRPGAYSAYQALYTCLRAGGMVSMAALTRRAHPAIAGWILVNTVVALVGPRLRVGRVPRALALARLARIGMPLAVASLAINVAATADRFIVALLRGREAAGVYSFGYMLGESALALPASVPYLAAFWLATRAWDSGRDRDALKLIRALVRVQAAVAVGVVLVIAFAAAPILHLVTHGGYLAGAPVFVVVAAAQVPAGIGPYLILVATLRRQTTQTIAPSAVAAVGNIVLTVPAVHFAGIIGAAAATLATYVLYCALLARSVCPTVSTRVAAGMLVAVVATAGMAFTSTVAALVLLGVVATASTALAVTGSGWKDTARSAT